MTSEAIDHLLRHPGLWRLGDRGAGGPAALPTGHRELDAVLPGGGWPTGALSEVLHDRPGLGEMRLLLPALATLSQRGQWLALVGPPYLPYPPALAGDGVALDHLLLVHPRHGHDALWAMEQALRSPTCGAVVAWPRRVDERSLRRLQLAAEAGGGIGLLMRPLAAVEHPSPAALRLRLEGGVAAPRVTVLKCRGAPAGPVALTPAGGPAPGTPRHRAPRQLAQASLPLGGLEG